MKHLKLSKNLSGGKINHSRISGLFKPLIASSLALTLGISVGVAQGNCPTTSGVAGQDSRTGTPVFCYGSDASSSQQWPPTSSTDFTWNGATPDGGSGDTNNYWMPIESEHNPFDILKIVFNNSNGDSPTGSKVNSNNYSITLKNNYFALKGGGNRGIQLKNDGNGWLMIDFNKQTNSKTFELDLSQATAGGNPSFKGNIEVIRGHDKDNSKFIAKFKNGMKGNIQVQQGEASLEFTTNKIDGAIDNFSSATYTFKQNTEITGYVKIHANSTTTMTFENSQLNSPASKIGDLHLNNGTADLTFKGIGEIKSINIATNVKGTATIDFQQSGSKVSGNIQKNGRNSGSHENIITFKKYGDIDGNIIADRSRGNRDARADAILTVKFGESNDIDRNSSITNTVKGSVESIVGWANAYWGINARTNVLFYNKGVIEGGIKASKSNSGSGFSTVTFYRDGTINGSILTNGGSNTISFNGATSTNQMTGNISANGGSNTISFNGATSTNQMTGNISANGGSNTISFNGATSTNQMTGNITVGSGGASGNNKILFKGNSSTFGTSDQKVDITSSQTNGNRTDKENLIKFSSTTNILTIGTMHSSITTGTGGNGIARNVLSLDSGTSTVSINTIEAGSLGSNYIGQGFLKGGDSSASDLSFQDNGAALNGKILVDSIIANRGGKNVIKANSSGATNLSGFDSTGKRIDDRNAGNHIKTIRANSGTNELTLQGVSTISTSVSASGGTNSITFDGSNSNNTISGNITASGGTNKITFSGSSSTNKIGQDTSGVSIASTGGTNKIILNASGTANNTLSLNSVTATGGKNSIGKDDLSNVADGGFTFNSSNGIASQAFEGTLKITEGIKGSDGGWNNIAFKAKNGQTTPVISNTSGNAAEGNMNLYLDMSAITPTNETNPTIKGNVSNGSNGQVNIYIKGKQDSSETNPTIGLAGNITTNGGTTGIIFEDAIWAPTNAKDLVGQQRQSEEVTPPTSGVLTAQGDRGTTTIILRKSSNTPTTDQATEKVPLFTVNNQTTGTGEVNIVMQGPVGVGANLNYKTGKTNLVFAGSNSGTDSFKWDDATDSSNNKFLGKTYKDGVKLELADKMVKVVGQEENKSFIDTYGEIFRKANGDNLLTIKTSRVNDGETREERATQTDTISVNGLAVGTISDLSASSTGSGTTYNYNVTLEKDAAFVGSMSLQANSKINLVLKQGAKLLTDSDHLKIQTLTLGNGSNGGLTYDSTQLLNNTFDQTNTVIDLVTMGNDFAGFVEERSAFRLLEVGTKSNGVPGGYAVTQSGLKGGNGLFRVYMNSNAAQGNSNGDATLGGNNNKSNNGSGTYGYTYSDRIVIHEGNGATGAGSNSKNYIQVIADANTDLSSIRYHGGGTETANNIAVATVKGANGSQVATFEGAAQRQGFDIIGTTLEAVSGTDAGGKTNGSTAGTGNDYTTYFVSSMESRGVASTDQQASASALGLNYEIFLANFNSLNKRMGELRNNDHSQGAWGRIFNGMLESSYGLQTKSLYTTIQAGYDYAFGFEGANNYVGIALSYANAIVDPKSTFDEFGKVGIDKANQHAIEIAIYNSYVQDEGWFNDTIAKFSYMMNSINMMNQSSNYSVNNFGVVFSDEFGYRFKLGEEKEWFIDPQAEVGFGYFDQSKLKQVLGDYSLDGVQDHIMTLRSRVGVNWGYDFKKFTEGKDIGASLYVGTYYTYDYITGGEINLTSNFGSKVKTNVLNSTGRFDLNVGTNISIKDNTRLYVDFERSFGGDITTVYQVNLGVRYSFGEGNYTPVVQKANAREDFVPLKLEIEEIQPEEPKPIEPIEILQPIQPVQPTELIQPVEPTLEEVIEEPRIEEQIVSQIKFQKTLQVMKVEKLVNSLNTVSAKIFSNSFLKNSIDNLLTSLRYLQFFSVIPDGNSQKDKDQKQESRRE